MIHLPFELDFSLKLKRRQRRSQEFVPPKYPLGRESLVGNRAWRPSTPVVSPISPNQATNGFAQLGNTQDLISELPGNAANIPRPQYQSGLAVPQGNDARRSSSSHAYPTLPRIITTPAHPDYYIDEKPPISPPATPIGTSELELLKVFRTVFIVDDSTSMISSGHLTSVYDLLEKIAPLAAQRGERSVEIQFLSDERQAHTQTIKAGDRLPAGDVFWHGVTARGGASMSGALKRVIKPHLSGLRKSNALKTDGLNIIVITDGKRKDRKDVEKYIVDVAKRLTDKGAPQHLVGIQFVQVGEDQSAKAFFRSVDDELEEKYQIRDIVDTVVHTQPSFELTNYGIEKILLGGISDTKDKMVMM